MVCGFVVWSFTVWGSVASQPYYVSSLRLDQAGSAKGLHMDTVPLGINTHMCGAGQRDREGERKGELLLAYSGGGGHMCKASCASE